MTAVRHSVGGREPVILTSNGFFDHMGGRVLPHTLRPTAGLDSTYEKNNHLLSHRRCRCVVIRLRL